MQIHRDTYQYRPIYTTHNDTYQYIPIPINMFSTYNMYNTYKYIPIPEHIKCQYIPCYSYQKQYIPVTNTYHNTNYDKYQYIP